MNQIYYLLYFTVTLDTKTPKFKNNENTTAFYMKMVLRLEARVVRAAPPGGTWNSNISVPRRVHVRGGASPAELVTNRKVHGVHSKVYWVQHLATCKLRQRTHGQAKMSDTIN